MGKQRPEVVLAPVIRAQHGPFTTAQALAAGFSSSAVGRRVRSGRWLAPYRGVLCDASVPPSLQRDASAAVLACGPGAATSHRLAAQLWEVDVPRHERPDVSVLGRARPPGICVHETTRLTPAEAAPMDGIPVTSPMRTLLDLAGMIDARLLELALDRLWRRRLIEPRRFLDYLSDPWCTQKRGSAVLRDLVRERLGQRPSDSDLETQFLQLVRDANLPLPGRQQPVVTALGVRYLDLAYLEPRVAIELDGMERRFDAEVFLDDRVRQNMIDGQGWRFRRFGHTHVKQDRLWTVFSVAEALKLWPTTWRRQ